MKADFIPQLEDEEDTSYFDMRTDRYNHEDEDEDEQVRSGFNRLDPVLTGYVTFCISKEMLFLIEMRTDRYEDKSH